MRNEILGAVARGWCSPENEHKEMDATLAEAITDEVMKIIDAKFISHNSRYLVQRKPLHPNPTSRTSDNGKRCRKCEVKNETI